MSSRCLPPAIARYLARRAVSGPWLLEGDAAGSFQGAVVIPALAELDSLFVTLASLAANPAEWLRRFLVVVVVNHGPDADGPIRTANRDTLTGLQRYAARAGALRLAWVDAASPGRKLPRKHGGVGLARKIGFDLALPRLDYGGHLPPVLVALDADTVVDSAYLEAIAGHFAAAEAGGAVLPFCHQQAPSPPEQEAIDIYELFLRHYVLGLSLAGSPFAFHTVGSAMAFRAEAYAGAGGMNRRRAGEDFYFLQQLAKTTGVAELAGTVVRPSPRPSQRTPFGTGRAVDRWLAGDKESVRFHHVATFRLLGEWLSLATTHWQRAAEDVLASAFALSSPLGRYLESCDFARSWHRLQRNHRQRDAFLASFHTWFDGLRTLKLLHRLGHGEMAPGAAGQNLPALLRWAGLDSANTVASQLRCLRRVQLGADFPAEFAKPLETTPVFATMI